MNWVVAIGAGPSQVPYIKLLKEWGYRVLATDRQADAPGFALADKKAAVSTYDAENTCLQVQEMLAGEKIAGVIAPCTGEPLRTAHRVKKNLGLPALPTETVESLLHKGRLRERLNLLSNEPVFCRVVKTADKLEKLARQIEYPVIVKPARGGMGGRGVNLVDQPERMAAAFEAAQKAGLIDEVVVESLIDGEEYGVSALVYGGELYVFVVGRALKDSKLNEIPVGEVIGPGLLPDETTAAMKSLLLAACSEFQLEQATINVDMIVEKGKQPQIIEIEFAFADAFDLLATACEYDLRTNALRVMIGLEPERLERIDCGAEKRYFIHSRPELELVEGRANARAVNGVVRLDLDEEVRLKLEMPDYTAYMRGHVLVKGADAREAELAVEEVLHRLVFEPKSVLLIGMGDNTWPIVQKAREAGLKVICANRNARARVFDYADIALNLDGKDLEGLLAYLFTDEQARNLAGVYSGSDLFLTAANLAQAAGHDGLSVKAAFAAQNKAVSKILWQKAGMKTPRARLAGSRAEVSRFEEELTFPCVVKPVDANSSRGIRRTDSAEELGPAVETALQWSAVGKILVEPFISGRLLDINGFFEGGYFYRAGIVERWSQGSSFFAVDRAACPAVLTPGEEDAVYKLLEQASRALEIKDGPVKGDVLLAEDGPCILEVAPRFHGIVASLYLIPLALGIDAYADYFRRLKTGQLKDGAFEATTSRLAVARTIRVPAGQITAVERSEEALDIPGIEAVFWQKKAGDLVKAAAESNEDIAGYVIADGENRKAVDGALEKFIETIKIKVE